jgi:hypothetical protein
LFSDRLLVGLAPAALTVRRFRGLLKEKLVESASVACDPAFGNEPWQGAVAALKALPIEGRAKVTVVLANHFVRYAIVPWSEALGTEQERQAYLLHHFAKIHGERAKAWALRAAPSGTNEPRLASAVDSSLIAAIKEALQKRAGTRLVSVQPQLMAKFNAARAAVPASGAWLVLAEPDRACVALHAGGRWRSVQNAKGAWLDLLERERHRVEGELPELVLLAGASSPAAASSSAAASSTAARGGWNFRELAA